MNQQPSIYVSAEPPTVAIWSQGLARAVSTIVVDCVDPDGTPTAEASVQLRCGRGLVSVREANEWSREATSKTDATGRVLFDFSVAWGTGARPGINELEVLSCFANGRIERAAIQVLAVGPPAFMTMTAAPARIVSGEMATILITVTDAINQKVADETRVSLQTNWGGLIVPAEAKTFGGVAAAYLLTSDVHVGAYEIVALTLDDPPGTPSIMSVVTVVTTHREESPRSSIDEILASVNRPSHAPSEMRTRVLKTIMFSDIENSTSGNKEIGDEAWGDIRREHDKILCDEVARNGGTEVKHLGDGFMCSFGLPGDAALCAIGIQRRLAEYRDAHAEGKRKLLRVRIGIHAGEVDQEGTDLFGTEVNLAARVASSAEPNPGFRFDSASSSGAP